MAARRLTVVTYALLVALLGAGAAGARSETGIYTGLGAWIDIFDKRVWTSPDGPTAAMARRGVTTLYVETSNSSQSADLVRPAQLGRLVESAHAAGLQVVAWYLPTLVSPAKDLRRSLAAMDFITPNGEVFDSFALDIESSAVKKIAIRNRRLLALAGAIRSAAPEGYELGAIVPSPVGIQLHPSYWPGFPWAELRLSFDAFLPMAYFTYLRRTPAQVSDYVRSVVESIRGDTADPSVPIHLVGGIANRASPAALQSFVEASSACGSVGASLYDFATTTAAGWTALAGFAPTTDGVC